jgi:NADH dehydrogenase (ubiquinone) 1 beta subcomplex subunit 3
MPSLYRDPWAAREAWRRHPIFSNRFMFRNIFPGIGLGVGAFAAYFAVDRLFHPGNIEKLKEDAKKQREKKSIFEL